jgi:hypothetical protein
VLRSVVRGSFLMVGGGVGGPCCNRGKSIWEMRQLKMGKLQLGLGTTGKLYSGFGVLRQYFVSGAAFGQSPMNDLLNL